MKVKQFLNIPFSAVELVKRFVVPSDTLAGTQCKNLWDMSFEKVQELKELMSEGKVITCMATALTSTRKVNEKMILKCQHTDFMYFLKWLEDQFKTLNEREEQLNHDPKPELLEAGINELQVFGYLNVVDSLAGGDILKWKEISTLPYKEVYTKLLKEKVTNTIQERLLEIQKRKNRS